jgi:hypothetical protein
VTCLKKQKLTLDFGVASGVPPVGVILSELLLLLGLKLKLLEVAIAVKLVNAARPIISIKKTY